MTELYCWGLDFGVPGALAGVRKHRERPNLYVLDKIMGWSDWRHLDGCTAWLSGMLYMRTDNEGVAQDVLFQCEDSWIDGNHSHESIKSLEQSAGPFRAKAASYHVPWCARPQWSEWVRAFGLKGNEPKKEADPALDFAFKVNFGRPPSDYPTTEHGRDAALLAVFRLQLAGAGIPHEEIGFKRPPRRRRRSAAEWRAIAKKRGRK